VINPPPTFLRQGWGPPPTQKKSATPPPPPLAWKSHTPHQGTQRGTYPLFPPRCFTSESHIVIPPGSGKLPHPHLFLRQGGSPAPRVEKPYPPPRYPWGYFTPLSAAMLHVEESHSYTARIRQTTPPPPGLSLGWGPPPTFF